MKYHINLTSKKKVIALALVFLLIIVSVGTGYFLQRNTTNIVPKAATTSTTTLAKLEPASGKKLYGIGQSFTSLDGYNYFQNEEKPAIDLIKERTGTMPHLLSAYGSIVRKEGDSLALIENKFKQAIQISKESGNQYGLILGIYGPTDERFPTLVQGGYDANIRAIGAKVKSLYDSGEYRAPLFIRPFYEINAPWGGFGSDLMARHPEMTQAQADLYANQIYKNFVIRFREGAGNLPNVAFILHYNVTPESDAVQISRFNTIYPGNEYVDWVGISWYSDAIYRTKPLLDFARSKNKPVIIPESANHTVDITDTAQMKSYFSKYFALVNDPNNRIKAYEYVNLDLGAQSRREGGNFDDWKNSRLQDNPDILRVFINEVSKSQYKFAFKSNSTAITDLSTIAKPSIALSGKYLWERTCTIDLNSGAVDGNSCSGFTKTDLSNMRNLGNESYSAYETFLFANNTKLRQSFISADKKTSVYRDCGFSQTTGSVSCTSQFIASDTSNRRSVGNEEYIGYATYSYSNYINLTLLDAFGTHIYTSRCTIDQNTGTLSTSTCTPYKTFSLQYEFPAKARVGSYETFLYANNTKVRTSYISYDGKTQYYRSCSFSQSTGTVSCTEPWTASSLTNMRGTGGGETYYGYSAIIFKQGNITKIRQFFLSNS